MRSVCTEDTVEFPALSVLCCPAVTLLWIVGECEAKDIGEDEVVVDVVDVENNGDDDDDDDVDSDDVEDGTEVVVDLIVVGEESVVVDVFVVVVRDSDVVNDTA